MLDMRWNDDRSCRFPTNIGSVEFKITLPHYFELLRARLLPLIVKMEMKKG